MKYTPRICLKSSLSIGTGAADTRYGRLKPISAANVNKSFQYKAPEIHSPTEEWCG